MLFEDIVRVVTCMHGNFHFLSASVEMFQYSGWQLFWSIHCMIIIVSLRLAYFIIYTTHCHYNIISAGNKLKCVTNYKFNVL